MSLVEMGFSLGGGLFTLGAGGVPSFSVVTLGYRCLFVDRLLRGVSDVAIGSFVSPIQCPIVSWRALRAWSLESTLDDSVFLSAAVSCFTPCRTLSSGVTEGGVSL